MLFFSGFVHRATPTTTTHRIFSKGMELDLLVSHETTVEFAALTIMTELVFAAKQLH
jgi:hypothetical protein